MDRILEAAFLVVSIAFLIFVAVLSVYSFVKQKKSPALPEGVSAELKNPSYLIWLFTFSGLNLFTNLMNTLNGSEKRTKLYTAATIIFCIAWVILFIEFIISFITRQKCSITENGIVISNGRTIAPGTCWYELNGNIMHIIDRKTNARSTYIITGSMKELDAVLKAAYTPHS